MKKLEEIQKTAEKIVMHFIYGGLYKFPKEVNKKFIYDLADAFKSKRGRYEWEVDSVIRKLIDFGF